MKISVIIPCFNEENTIKKIVEKVRENSNFFLEIIIIDDHSSDKTREIIENDLKTKVDLIILNDQNYGKGFSVRKGIDAATGDIILIQDADLEYNPSDYGKLLKPIMDDVADVVYGSRFVGSEEKRVLYFWHMLGLSLIHI